MTPRIKKLAGLFILLPGLTAYVFAAAALSEKVPDNTIIKLGYFVVAGIAWAFPTKYLIKWMNADPQNGG